MTIRTLFALFAAFSLCACPPKEPLASTASPVAGQSQTGLVTAADPRAAEAGMDMLRMGGNATDAAIATMLALTVVEPQSSGIGGGGFLLLGTPDGSVTTYDGRETAPSAAGPDWFLGSDGKPIGYREVVLTGKSVGVPGNIALAAKAHAERGRLPWKTLFQPAIALARDGFRINPRLYMSLDAYRERAGNSAFGRNLYFEADGSPKPVGTLIVNPELAGTFEAMAEMGAQAFYTGARAETLAETVAAATPGEARMSAADVAAYRAKERETVCGSYRGYRICGMGPPSSGGIAVLAMLGQLERFDLAAMGPDSLTFWQLFVDSKRLAYADRELYTGDGDFVSVPVAGLVEPDYLAARSLLLQPGRALASAEPGSPRGAPAPAGDGDEPPENGTSHFVAVDGEGNMASWTSTIEGAFGSGLMTGGFFLNNELTDFSFSPEADGLPVANRVESGKRPRSSMAPTIIYAPDGEPFMLVGAAGGATIPVQVARSIIGVIDFGLPLEDALGLPLVTTFRETVIVEEGSSLEPRMAELSAMGFSNVRSATPPFRAVGAIRTPDGWVGAYDPRLKGVLAIPD
ncbi:gamma-glutamyltransferase [Paraurantiacibacter namhicola]|uniref:Glutathione hydrolase proenzyme n=1 Tax=Paraurantiacibacter namhicola TaxID=645517 RepID=A0A1C7D634_9SPHN|nr:gamma-glutamyltransferase [Paraurantiacibacter namhicola]ANU06791.1 Gamma-glutamyltranspeptidase precursor [Paraurantiacibacter namhicola]